jgi:hypothetical protein
MITLEDTEAAIKRCEQHLQRAATDDASPKAKVLATEIVISGQDTAAELAALKATTKAQDAKIKALSVQVNILEGTLGSGTRIQLTGITGATTESERADAVFPVLAVDGSRHPISIRGKNIVASRATDHILSLAVLLNAVYKVNFRVGTDLDPTDGGDLYTPKGKRLEM